MIVVVMTDGMRNDDTWQMSLIRRYVEILVDSLVKPQPLIG